MGLELEGTGESCGGLTQLTVHIRVKTHIDWFLSFTPPAAQEYASKNSGVRNSHQVTYDRKFPDAVLQRKHN